MPGTDFSQLMHGPLYLKDRAVDFIVEQPDLDPSTIT